MKHRKYIFTSKKTSHKAIMATILGIISNVSLGIVIYKSYRDAGQTEHGYGFTALLAMIFSLTGLIMAVNCVRKKDYYRLLPITGIILNIIALVILAMILRVAQIYQAFFGAGMEDVWSRKNWRFITSGTSL